MKQTLLILIALSFSSLSFAAKTESNKVGYVDMQKAITETKGGKAAFKKLKAFQEQKQKQLDAKKKEIEKERAEIEKKFAVYSNEKKAQVQQGFQKKALAAEKYFRDSQLELAQKEKTLIEPVIKGCLLYTSPSPRDQRGSRMPSSA